MLSHYFMLHYYYFYNYYYYETVSLFCDLLFRNYNEEIYLFIIPQEVSIKASID